jgi:Uma2 family endonuclease
MVVAMPVEPVISSGGAFTYADLQRAPDDNYRYEIVDGVLLVSAAPGRLHQRAVGRLYARLDAACPPDLEVLVAPFDVVLADDTVLEPDVVVARRSQLTEKNLPGPPELAVEVLSDSTRLIDLNLKKARLQRSGTPCYWVVDPSARPEEARLVAWELDDEGRYQQVAEVVGEKEFHASRPYPVSVAPASLVR